MKLFELRTTLDWEWKVDFDDTVNVHFDVGDKHYVVTFDPFDFPGIDVTGNRWDVSFALVPKKGEPTMKITGTGDAPTVFAAVMAIVNEFLEKYQPDVLAFSAEEPERFRLYSRLLNMLGRQGWETEEREIGSSRIYEISRPGFKK